MIAQLLTISYWTTGLAVAVLYLSFTIPLVFAASISEHGGEKASEEYQAWRNTPFNTALQRSMLVSGPAFLLGLVMVIVLSIVQAVS